MEFRTNMIGKKVIMNDPKIHTIMPNKYPEYKTIGIILEENPEEEEKPNHLLRDDEDDEAELLERLMQQTTDALEMNNYDDLGALERPHLFRSESGLQKRPTALGRKVDYVKAKDRLRHVPRYRFFTFDGEKLRILNRSISVDSKKKPFIERRKLYTLGRVDIGEGPKIMMTYKHPTIWDFSKGKIRRNSFS